MLCPDINPFDEAGNVIVAATNSSLADLSFVSDWVRTVREDEI
jgi:hypothetical protein